MSRGKVSVMGTDRLDKERLDRREARRNWPLRVFRSGEAPVQEQEFLHHLSVEERLQAAHELTEMCWRLAGREIPNLPRDQWPFKIVRGDQRET